MAKGKWKNRIVLSLVPVLLVISMVAIGTIGYRAAVASEPTPAVVAPESAGGADNSINRNVIFLHPDGFALSHWHALRVYLVGPDGELNWDKLPYMAPYAGHMKDHLTGSSCGTGTIHAYGAKVYRISSFGMHDNQEIRALSGKKMSIMEEAIEAGFATALVGSGCLTEPGTAVFVASTEDRGMREEQALQVIESGVDVMLAGGERWLLPEGVIGRHGVGRRKDGVNLIGRAKRLGYTVVFTRDELMEAVADRAITRVLGVFACGHTFQTMSEERLRAEGLPLYWPWTPSIAEMSAAALEILSRNPKAAERGIFLVAEEEGTDNLPNSLNARGSFEAGRRADEALGVFIDFVANNPNTLLITTADSSAAAKHIIGLVPGVEKVGETRMNSGVDGEWTSVPMDGIDGAGTAPFMSAPDRAGNRFPFAVTWATGSDVSGGVVVRAKGLNAERVTQLGVVDNTDIYRIMYYTLFDRWLPKPACLLRRAPQLAELLGRAVIPADTFVAGPTSGQYIGPGPFFGRVPPFEDKQPVQGISAIIAQKDGSFLAMSDNGFGSRANSPDYLLTVYRLRPDFREGTVVIEGFIRLRDPNRHINFPIKNEHTPERYLTGSDFDLESFQVVPDGTFWFGEEFGPFLLQTDSRGVVLRAPIPLPDVKSPDNPFLVGEANLPRSGGFEGMALSVDGTKLFPMLERELVDDAYPDRRFIYEFDLEAGEFTGRKWYYRVETPEFRIGELIAINEEEFLVIERDGKQGEESKFKKLFKINMNRLDAEGFVYKELVANLLDIADPNLISLPGREGDIGLGETFSFPFVTIEAVAVIDPFTLVITNDNNFPFSAGRNPTRPDDTEIIKIRLASPLRLTFTPVEVE